MDDDFATELHELMHSWGWEEWQIDKALPRVLAVLEGIVILVRMGDVYVPTPLVGSDRAWRRAWELLKEEGVGGTAGG